MNLVKHGQTSTQRNPRPQTNVFKKLSLLDQFLSLWIILAMVIGVLLGYFTDISNALDTVKIDTVSLPIAIGLWLMMWPVLCKVRYELLWEILHQKEMWTQIGISLLLNWIVGPLLMTMFAWLTLFDLDGYRNGLILVGLARCIAMVLIWNQLAEGNAEFCAILVAINSIMQTVLYAPLAVFYLNIVSGQDEFTVNFWDVCRSVLIFLGIPLIAGILTRYTVILKKGRAWLDEKFLPAIGPIALAALIFTILVLFALQGYEVIHNIGDVFRVSVPMFLYFGLMWVGTLCLVRRTGADYEQAVTQAFTAASNNFELAIAIAVGTFGIKSQEALAATVGPLIEVPVLLALVYVALWLRDRLSWANKDNAGNYFIEMKNY